MIQLTNINKTYYTEKTSLHVLKGIDLLIDKGEYVSIMKKFFKIFLLVLLGVAVLGTFFYLWKKSQPVVKQYEITEVTVGNIEKRTVATGKISPRNEILIKPQMSGIIAEIYKEAGNKVTAGEIIAKIKVIPDMVSLNSAESNVSLAQIAFDQSKKDFDRDSKLFADKVISKEDFDKTRLQYEQYKQQLAAAKDNLSLVRDGITSNKSQMSNTLVRSTINGTILDIPVKVGNSVIQSNNFNDGTTIATVANMKVFVAGLFDVNVSGASDADFSGTTGKLYLESSGASGVDANQLIARTGDIHG